MYNILENILPRSTCRIKTGRISYVALRASFRAQHLALVKEYHNNGLVVMAGALTNPPDKAVFVFKCSDKSEVESFAAKDPYIQNGIIKSWDIREWTAVIGGE